MGVPDSWYTWPAVRAGLRGGKALPETTLQLHRAWLALEGPTAVLAGYSGCPLPPPLPLGLPKRPLHPGPPHPPAL